MRAAVVNTPVKVGKRNWESCWRAAAAQSFVHGQNEILTRAQKNAMLALCRKHGYGQYGIRQSPNPIFWDKQYWRFVRGRVHRIHPAGTGVRAKTWPGYNAARDINEVVLQRRGSKRQIAILNTHWAPPGGLKVPRKWRKQKIKQSKKLLRKLVRKHLRKGREVYVMGDFNLTGAFKMPTGFRWLHATKIDKVGVGIPQHLRVTDSSGHTFVAPTDHRHGGVVGAVSLEWR